MSEGIHSATITSLLDSMDKLRGLPRHEDLILAIAVRCRAMHQLLPTNELVAMIVALAKLESVFESNFLEELGSAMSKRQDLTPMQAVDALWALLSFGWKREETTKLAEMAARGVTSMTCLCAARLLHCLGKLRLVKMGKRVYEDAVSSIVREKCEGLNGRDIIHLFESVEALGEPLTEDLEVVLANVSSTYFHEFSASEAAKVLVGLSAGGRNLPDNLVKCALPRVRSVRKNLNYSHLDKILASLVVRIRSKEDCHVQRQHCSERIELAAIICEELASSPDRLSAPSLAVAVKALGELGYRPPFDVMSILASWAVRHKDRLVISEVTDVLEGFLQTGWQGVGNVDPVRALLKRINPLVESLSPSCAAKLLIAVGDSNFPLLPNTFARDTAMKLLSRVTMSTPILNTSMVVDVLCSCARSDGQRQHALLIESSGSQFLAKFADRVPKMSTSSACKSLLSLGESGLAPCQQSIDKIVCHIVARAKDLDLQDICDFWRGIGSLGESLSSQRLAILLKCTLTRVASHKSDMSDEGISRGKLSFQLLRIITHALWVTCISQECLRAEKVFQDPNQASSPGRSTFGDETISSLIAELLKNHLEIYSLNAIHAEERVRWGTPGSLPSDLEHELEWELLPRMHLFFLSYKNYAPELFKQLVSQSEDWKLLAFHARCRFTDLTMAEARVPIINEMLELANSFGLQLSKEEILDDCGYCPALCLRNKCVVIDVVDKGDLVLVNNASLTSDGNLRLRGWVRLKHDLLSVMGWNVLTVLKERWESLSGQDLEKSKYFFDNLRLRPYLTDLRINLSEPDVALRGVTDRNSAILFVERLACVFGNLRMLQPNHIMAIYKLLLHSPPVHQTRLASALMCSGLQERTFEVVRALSVQDIVFLAETLTEFLVEFDLMPYGSSRMEVRIKPELIQEIIRWTQEDRMCALTGRVWADAVGRWASALSKLSKEALESISAAVHSVLLHCHKPEYLSLLAGDPLCSILVACGKFPSTYQSSVSSSINIVLERIMSPEVFSTLNAQQIVELLGAYPYCGHYNLRAFRTMVDQAASLLASMTCHHIAMIARAHIRNMQSIEIIQPMLTSRLLQISDETSGGQWTLLKDCVSILVSLGLLGTHDDKVENILLNAVHTTCEKELRGVPYDVIAELLWVISLCRYSNQENPEIERVQVKLVGDFIAAWESGTLFLGDNRLVKMGNDKETNKNVLDDTHVVMLMQYCVWLRQRGAGAEAILSQLSEGFQALEETLKQFGIDMDARRAAANSEIFDDIAQVLSSMNTKFERAVAVHECGSSLGFKLHGVATTIEIYARDDCMQSSSQRGLSHKPAGLWIQRMNLLKRSGLMVLVVGFEQWGGLKKAEVLEGGEQPQARSEWLMKLINTSTWAKSLEPPAGMTATSACESSGWQMSMQVEQDDYSSGSELMELGSVSSRGSHVESLDEESASNRAMSAEGDRLKADDSKTKRMRQEGKQWTVHWSKGRNAWFYHNSETKQKVWKPPTVPGWIIKTGSGDHPPYVGLLHYYFNPESGQIAYEPPNA